MSNLMNIGQCALCKTQKDLVNSHFIPKHTYRKMRDRVKPGYAVMLIDGEGNNSTSNQITQRLLCNDCEQLLRENGEDFYSKNGYWSDDQPPRILESIVKDLQKQDVIKSGLLSTESERKLEYFVSSIFWRGTFSWPKYKPITVHENITEEMRSFLLESTLPRSYKIIVIPIYRENYSVSFPFGWPSSNGDMQYFFCIESLGYMLMSRDVFKWHYPTLDSESSALFYIRDDAFIDSYFTMFECNYNRSEKRGGKPHDISWLK